jgi:hypothetical protein
MRNSPRRPPGKRGLPEGVEPGRRREKATRGPARQPHTADPLAGDPVIARKAAGWESARDLNAMAMNAWANSSMFGEPMFGVSGWIVSGVAEPLPEGFARLSTLVGRGFQVIWTPHLGHRGHVTIVLNNPVDDVQAHAINDAFGREWPEEE